MSLKRYRRARGEDGRRPPSLSGVAWLVDSAFAAGALFVGTFAGRFAAFFGLGLVFVVGFTGALAAAVWASVVVPVLVAVLFMVCVHLRRVTMLNRLDRLGGYNPDTIADCCLQ